MPTERSSGENNNYDKIILSDIKKKNYIDFFKKYRYSFNIYDLFDATGYNLANAKKFLLKFENNQIMVDFEKYKDFLLSILPIYKWQSGSLDEIL